MKNTLYNIWNNISEHLAKTEYTPNISEKVFSIFKMATIPAFFISIVETFSGWYIVDDGVYFTSQDFVKTHASFPTTEKGIFEKYKSQDGYENVFQRFTTNAGAVFIRTFSGYSGNWTNWSKIEKAENQINSTATDVTQLVLDFNALLTRLRNAGLLNS